MPLRIIATVLNGLVILLAVLSLLGGGICFAVFGFFAGLFNLFALWKGVDYQDSKFNTFGLIGNAMVFINGVVALYQAFTFVGDGAAGSVMAGLLWAIGLVFVSSGIVSVIAVSQQNN